MALAGPTLLAADPDTSNVSTYATPSVSPTAGALVVIDVLSTDATSAIEPTITVGFAITGSIQEIAKAQHPSAARYVKSVYCVASGSPGSGTVQADYGGDAQTGCIIIVSEYTGQHATTPVLQGTADVTSGAGFTSKTMTLGGALQAASSIMHAAIGHSTNEDQTATGGGTELGSSDVGYATPAARLGVYSAVNDTSIGASWSTGANAWATACEIVEASGGASHTGAFDAAFTANIAVAGKKGGKGATSEAFAANISVAGKKGGYGSTSEAYVANISVAGKKGGKGAVARAYVVNIFTNGSNPAAPAVAKLRALLRVGK